MLQDTQQLLHNIEMELLFDSNDVDTESNAKYAQKVKKLLDSIKSVHCIFIHLKEYSQWAKGAAFPWNDTLMALACDIPSPFFSVVINQSQEEYLLGGVHNMRILLERYINFIMAALPDTKKVCMLFMVEYLFEPIQKLEHSMGWMLHSILQQLAMRFNESAFEAKSSLLFEDRFELLCMKSAFDANCLEL